MSNTAVGYKTPRVIPPAAPPAVPDIIPEYKKPRTLSESSPVEYVCSVPFAPPLDMEKDVMDSSKKTNDVNISYNLEKALYKIPPPPRPVLTIKIPKDDTPSHFMTSTPTDQEGHSPFFTSEHGSQGSPGFLPSPPDSPALLDTSDAPLLNDTLTPDIYEVQFNISKPCIVASKFNLVLLLLSIICNPVFGIAGLILEMMSRRAALKGYHFREQTLHFYSDILQFMGACVTFAISYFVLCYEFDDLEQYMNS